MNSMIRRVLGSILLLVCLGAVVLPTQATTALTITLDSPTTAPGATALVTVTSTLPAGATLSVTLPAPLTTTIQPSGCTATPDGWQCPLAESPQIVTFGVAAPASTPDGTAVTLSVQAGPATATTTLTVVGGPAATGTPLPSATATIPAATATPWVITATPSATTVPTTTHGPQPDGSEPNNTPSAATPIGLGSIDKLSFWPVADVDYFALPIKPSQAGLTLTLETTSDVGLDPHLRLLRPDGTVLAANDDRRPTDVQSHIAVQAEAGLLLVEVTNTSAAKPDYKLYRLTVTLTEVATPAPAVTATPDPAAVVWDAYSGNYGWAEAAPIAVGAPLDGLTFGCPNFPYLDSTRSTTCVVPDFFRLSVKGGTCYRAETRDLAPGIDTNVIVYGPQGDAAAPWGGNDDAAPGQFASSVPFCVPPDTGLLTAYVLVGQVGNVAPPPPIGERTYALQVAVVDPVADRPIPLTTVTPDTPPAGGAPVTAPPAGAVPAPSGAPSPAMGGAGAPETIPPPANQAEALPLPGVVVEEIPLSQAAEPTSVPQIVVPLAGVACYDRNQNRACDVDEGIAGVTVYVTDERSGALVAQALTDQTGRAALTVRVPETAMLIVSIPSFAATQRVSAQSPLTKPLMVTTVAPLPALLP